MAAVEPQYTAAEKARITVLVARMCKRSVAGPDVHQADLVRRIDRIKEGARKRAEQAAKKK
ncbi:DUF6257 family protein [Actinacidiphila oryziradicis]|uniref:Uncharacterized protein n=1 Tax=Actinacidiphila oryziradicis TaxID=2571141 RepID=A0A4U0SPC5_9ACTN|nr:DUF6257 family protein [Actinacidiphila oryziradicis]TKA11762.1 hypothetical protein FCI23_10555 [Actinacidiphila oryziradicis]